MDMILQRSSKRSDGIFSALTTDREAAVAMTLEHAYLTYGGYEPKLKPGFYDCVRGLHRLHGMDHDFETFEVTGVEGHKGILFHCGNVQADSEGCILVGEAMADDRIINSRKQFAEFMRLQEGAQTFMLTVLG